MATEVKHYSGWRPRSMRQGKSKHESDRGTKRSRLGNARDRALYKSPRAQRSNPEAYARLCRVADGLNGRKGV